jgi:hypothetical protein
MKITERQEEILDQLICQRLSDDPQNQVLIKDFCCAKGKGLVSYLHQYAWEEDVDGTTAFYLIKNQKGDILMFFSLKCGSLFNPLDEEEIQESINNNNHLLEAIRKEPDSNMEQETSELLEQILSGFGLTLEQIRDRLQQNVKNATKTLKALDRDRLQEPNDKIVRVGETYPGVELVHFLVVNSHNGKEVEGMYCHFTFRVDVDTFSTLA